MADDCKVLQKVEVGGRKAAKRSSLNCAVDTRESGTKVKMTLRTNEDG
jgi:hypothetical protein